MPLKITGDKKCERWSEKALGQLCSCVTHMDMLRNQRATRDSTRTPLTCVKAIKFWHFHEEWNVE